MSTLSTDRRRGTVLAVGLLSLIGCSAAEPVSRATPAAMSPTPSAAMSPTPSAAAEARPRQFTLAAAGDVLTHGDVRRQAAADGRRSGRDFDFAPLLSGIAARVRSADVAICHLETPLAAAGGPYQGYPSFSAPPELAASLAATGFDSCSTASNHSLDQGEAGVRRTLSTLDAAKLTHPGMARTATEARRPVIVEAAGVRIGHLSYTFGINGNPDLAGKAWLVNLIDGEQIRTDASAARSAGAEVVVVSLHWGLEYQHAPTSEQQQLAQRLTGSADIDLIIGHHAHVVQPVQRINDTWVAYGLGNSLVGPRHNFAAGATREGLLAEFTFTQRPNGRFQVTAGNLVPTYVATQPLRVLDVVAALAAPGEPSDRPRLKLAYERTQRAARGNQPWPAELAVTPLPSPGR